MMRKLNLIFMLFIVSLISIGFSSWVIIGENNNTHLLDEKINVGQNIEKDAPFVDLKAKKVVNKKEILDIYESHNLMMSPGTIESLDWTFSWKNKGTSETYSSLDLTKYFDIYDNNNPLCDNSPHLYNYDMKEYQYIDYHLLDTTQNQITSSIFYSPVYNSIFDDTKFIEDLKQQDIEKYGLFDYEFFDELLTKEQFTLFNVTYFSIAIGKGLYTPEFLIEMIYEFLSEDDRI